MLMLALLACSPEPVEGPFAIGFDGGEDCGEADFAAVDAPDTFTVELWMRGDSADAERPRPLVEWKGVFALGEILGGGSVFQAGDTEGATMVDTVMDGVLHHVAGTWDGDKASLYVDGVRQGFADGAPAVAPTSTLRIGCNSVADSFEGLLDELRLSSSLRYDGDFELPSGPFEADADTVALFHFDEGEGETSIDAAQGLTAGVYGIEWVPFKLDETGE